MGTSDSQLLKAGLFFTRLSAMDCVISFSVALQHEPKLQGGHETLLKATRKVVELLRLVVGNNEIQEATALRIFYAQSPKHYMTHREHFAN